jgi:hypothetical protein
MDEVLVLSQSLSKILDRLAVGYDMFGQYALWLWLLPPIWGVAASLMWMQADADEEARERLYVAEAERNLPSLRELAKARSIEILEPRGRDHLRR